MRHVPRPTGSSGFALPWVLFTLVILSLMAATGFLITWLEGRAARAFSLGTEAFYIAQSGLETAVAAAVGPNPALGPIPTGRGRAHVTFERLIDLGPGERLFRVESEGSVSSGGSTFRRRVGRIAWVAGPLRSRGALLAWGSIVGADPSGRVSGLDAGGGCGPSVAGQVTRAAPAPNFPAVATTGAPPSLVWPPTTSLATETGIRWTELLAPFGPTPDATVPPDPWPASSVAGGWPFIRLPGPATLGAGRSGRGVLLVDGDLSVGSGFSWDGLVLVGGRVTVSGNVGVRGSVVAGLAGTSGVAADLASATLDLRYDSCAVARAAARITAPAAGKPGTWYEVW